MTEIAVVAGRYARAIEAEVARAQLESEGIDCEVEHLEGTSELRVRAEELGAARAILDPQIVPTTRSTGACPSCGGRAADPQGRLFWSMLGVTVAFLVALAWFVTLPLLATLAAAGTAVLIVAELLLKDWACRRCGTRWRS